MFRLVFDRRLLKNFDWVLFFIPLLISIIGLVNLYSATYQTGFKVFQRQLVWVVLGVVAMVLISFLDYRTLERYTHHMYAVFILLLVAVLVFSKAVLGSKRWLSLGPVTIQPSEFVKILIILILAKFYHNDFEGGPYGLRDLIKPILFVAVPSVLVLLQPDLGTALIILLTSASLILFMGVRLKSLVFILAIILGFSYPAWHFALRDYQKERIETFLDSSRDPLGSGYNTIQSQIAVGSGKLLGKGFKKGSQTQLRFIPEQHTDFAFSVLCEEWGFVGGAFALLLYFLLVLWILDMASLAKDKFSMALSFGVASMFFWHTLINVGMVTGIIPVVGVPLPLLSYGGSSALTVMMGIGMVLGIKMRKLPMSKEKIVLE
ncbi:MAG: rod shape-determining protein RodA [Candidatus Dadabacteria bacterium]